MVQIGFKSILLSIFFALVCSYFNFEFCIVLSNIISHLFTSFLKLVSLPIVFLSIISSLSGLESFNTIKTIGKMIISYTFITTLMASSLAACLYILIKPAIAVTLPETKNAGHSIFKLSYYEHIQNVIPSNFVSAFLDNNIFGVILIAFLIGGAALSLESKQKKLIHEISSSFFAAMIKIASLIISTIPIAIFAFIILFIHDLNGTEELLSLTRYWLCVLSANLIQGAVILPSFLILNRISVKNTFTGSLPALIIAFFSKSSGAALPTTIKCATDNLKISKEVASFSIPLCSTINMNACAAFILITVLFVTEMNGIKATYTDILFWIPASTIAAIGNASVPMGCYFIVTTLLLALGIPLHIMALILPVYLILDMLETAINVWSDLCIATIVNKHYTNK